MDELDAYLDELVAHLDCDPLRRDEIRLEVHAHLRELVDAHRARGASPQEAAETAIREFGPAEEVARRLTAANLDRVPVQVRVPVARRALGILVGGVACGMALIGLIWVGLLLVHQSDYDYLAHGTEWNAPVFWVALAAYTMAGALAALVIWRMSRRPWDALVVCIVTDLLVAWLQPDQDSRIAALAVVAPVLFAGVALVALLLRRRTKSPVPLCEHI